MGVSCVNTLFAETLRKLRTERGLSQKQLGKQLFVYHSTIARWESGIRLPDAAMIPRLAKCLGVDANTLFHLAADSDEIPNVIMVDDNEVVLSHGLTVLGKVMPNAAVTGFTRSVEAIEYAKMNRTSTKNTETEDSITRCFRNTLSSLYSRALSCATMATILLRTTFATASPVHSARGSASITNAGDL